MMRLIKTPPVMGALILALFLLPGLCLAQEQPVPANPLEGQSLTESLVKVTGSLALVLGLVVGLYWLSRRFLPGPAASVGGRMKVIGRLGLGPRKNLTLVELAGQVLVLGVSADRINLLATIDDPEKIQSLKTQGEASFLKAFKKASKAAGAEDS